MIDYETFCKIKHYREEEHLTLAQTARALGLHPLTVAKWATREQYRARRSASRASKLDPFKRDIVRWLEAHPLSAAQIFQRLKEAGYPGGYTIVKDYVSRVRPRRAPAFLTLAFAPGEAAQVDWGEYGSIALGTTRRRLSFFVMVLCYSRFILYLLKALRPCRSGSCTWSSPSRKPWSIFLPVTSTPSGVPSKIMVDNLKSAVLEHLIGQAPVFNSRYLDFAHHYGFTIAACGVRKGNEKGRVERGVGYVKKNFLNGLEGADFSAMNPAARVWLDTTANVRLHGETHERPTERFQAEQAHLKPLPTQAYDIASIRSVRASKQFRVTLDTNRYSVPAEYASAHVTLKVYPDRLCVYDREKLIARHLRSYERHQDIEDPDHPRMLLEQRRNAREQKLLMRFLTLSPKAQDYYQELQQRRLNPGHHLRKIVALSDIYGVEAVARAMQDAFTFQAFSCEYIANLLESRARSLPEPSALHLTRRQDLLEIEVPEPNLSVYEGM